MKLVLALLAMLTPAAAFAANNVSLSSQVFVEKRVPDAQGRVAARLDAPKVVVPGDHLVFVLNYRNQGAQPASDFVVTNPLPGAISYQGTDDAGATYSVDGGKSWGPLATLRAARPDGQMRPARAEDITHVRWVFARPIPAGQGGKLSFRGIVK